MGWTGVAGARVREFCLEWWLCKDKGGQEWVGQGSVIFGLEKVKHRMGWTDCKSKGRP